MSPCARCHDNGESDKERKTTVRVQRARANKRLSAHRSATSAGTNSPFCVILKNMSPKLDIHCNACLQHFNSSIDQNQRNERDEDLLFVCLHPSYAQARRHLPHTITPTEIWASHPRLTYAAENSHKHRQTLDILAKKKIWREPKKERTKKMERTKKCRKPKNVARCRRQFMTHTCFFWAEWLSRQINNG